MKTFWKFCMVLALLLVVPLLVAPITINGLVQHDLDGQVTTGLLGTKDSIAYRIHDIERHFHSWERWFGLSGAPNGEITRMAAIGTTVNPFQADGGDNTWGTWLQVVGSGDTPVQGTSPYFDFHRLYIVDVERNTATHFIRVGCDASGADALTNGNYTELVYKPNTVQSSALPLDLWMRRAMDTTKCWVQVWVVGQNTGTVDFFFGMHEYEG